MNSKNTLLFSKKFTFVLFVFLLGMTELALGHSGCGRDRDDDDTLFIPKGQFQQSCAKLRDSRRYSGSQGHRKICIGDPLNDSINDSIGAGLYSSLNIRGECIWLDGSDVWFEITTLAPNSSVLVPSGDRNFYDLFILKEKNEGFAGFAGAISRRASTLDAKGNWGADMLIEGTALTKDGFQNVEAVSKFSFAGTTRNSFNWNYEGPVAFQTEELLPRKTYNSRKERQKLISLRFNVSRDQICSKAHGGRCQFKSVWLTSELFSAYGDDVSSLQNVCIE